MQNQESSSSTSKAQVKSKELLASTSNTHPISTQTSIFDLLWTSIAICLGYALGHLGQYFICKDDCVGAGVRMKENTPSRIVDMSTITGLDEQE